MNIKLPIFSSHRKINTAGCILGAFLLIGLFLPLNLAAQEMGVPVAPVKSTNQTSETNSIAKRWEAQRAKAMEGRLEPVGIFGMYLYVPEELNERTGGEKVKIAELSRKGQINVPMDFVALAKMKASGKLVTVGMVSDTYFLDVGGSSSSGEFTTFSFGKGDVPVKQGSPDYAALSDHINILDGKKLDLTRESDRRRLRIQLLQMLAPEAKQVLVELTAAYSEKFGRPLRITSLVRSVDYQIYLSKTNPNAFKVTKESPPAPHATGLAFDIPTSNLTGAEQNFLMKKLAEMENAGKVDAFAETKENIANILHVFVYPDGKPTAE